MVKKYYYYPTIILCLLISLFCLVVAKAVFAQETSAKSSLPTEEGTIKTAPESLPPEKLSVTLAAYTGLQKTYVKNSHLKISRDDFLRELLRQDNRRLGVLDSRITGSYRVHGFMEDPSVFAVTGPLVATWNDYVRRELRYENDLPYTFLSIQANRLWDWGSATGGLGYVNVATTLQQAMSENKFLKVFIASGYYDLDTSYFATKYTVNHLELEPVLRGGILLWPSMMPDTRCIPILPL